MQMEENEEAKNDDKYRNEKKTMRLIVRWASMEDAKRREEMVIVEREEYIGMRSRKRLKRNQSY